MKGTQYVNETSNELNLLKFCEKNKKKKTAPPYAVTDTLSKLCQTVRTGNADQSAWRILPLEGSLERLKTNALRKVK